VGYPDAFFLKPELELVGWAPRLPLADLIFTDQWGRRAQDHPGEFADGVVGGTLER
jgi:hypothetical protein